MTSNTTQKDLDALFNAGAHFAYSRSRRHPSATNMIFGTKDRNDIFDLEKTAEGLADMVSFVANTASLGKQILLVGGKPEASAVVKSAAEKTDLPHVSSRWIGGTLSNFGEIRSRVNRLLELRSARDAGLRDKYTKRERLEQDREIEKLEFRFNGITNMERLPAALFIVDPRHEDKAVREANQLGIPVIALANSDCDFGRIQHAVPANDSAIKSINYVVDAFVDAYSENFKAVAAPAEAPKKA